MQHCRNIIDALSGNRGRRSPFERLLDLAISALDAERGFLVVRSGKRDKAKVLAARNMDQETLRGASGRVSNTIVDRVLKSGETVLLTDAGQKGAFALEASVAAMKLRSVLCSPILLDGAPVGALYVDNRFIPQKFGPAEARMAETLSAAGNIFVGQTESPLLIRPYVKDLTISELAAVMTGGFATIAGSVFVLYVSFGIDAGHLLTASVMSAPAALMIAKIMFPEREESKTLGSIKVKMERDSQNVVDAAASGAAMGLKLALNVAAMLLAFVALLAMINWLLGYVGQAIELIAGDVFAGETSLSLAMIFGWVFAPLAWCLGVVGGDTLFMGELIGTKLSLNELIAYGELAKATEAGLISAKTTVIGTYALCGFANLSSIAIVIGGIGGIAPERRGDLARLGLKAMLAGAFASMTTAALAGILI